MQPFASLIDHVGPTVPRLLLNRERVGERAALSAEEAEAAGGSLRGGGGGGFDFEGLGPGPRRDVYVAGDADDGVAALAELLGWGSELEALVAADRC